MQALPQAAAYEAQPLVAEAAVLPDAAVGEAAAPTDAAAEVAEVVAPDAGAAEAVAPDAGAELAVPAAPPAGEPWALPWAAAWIFLLPWPARRRSAPIAPVIALSPTAWP